MKLLLRAFVAVLLTAGAWLVPAPAAAAPAQSIWGLHVVGNQIVNGEGQVFRPVGVNRSGTEYPCVQGWGIIDGPHDAAAVDLIAGWHPNMVRIPLNEDCWLDINGVNPATGGAAYRQAIGDLVRLLNSRGMAVVLDLHWNAPGTARATGQKPMPDLDHAPAFWASVASTFKGNSSVLFDLYNEPFTTSWDCWRDGSAAAGAAPCTDVPFAAAGMQTLLNAVRSTGARNVLMLGGLRWANNLTGWLSHMPADPLHNLAAAFHIYNWNACIHTGCWDSEVQPVLDRVPLVTGEMGEGDFAPAGIHDCGQTFVDNVMNWMDRRGAGYLAWAWVPYGCGFPSLLTSWDGTPSEEGSGVKNRLTSLASSGLEGYGGAQLRSDGVTEEQVLFRHSAPLTGTVITITVQKDPGMQAVAARSTLQPDLDVSITDTGSQIVYTFTQRAGRVLQPSATYQREEVSGLFREGGQTVHDATRDTFSVTARTTGRQPVLVTGTIGV